MNNVYFENVIQVGKLYLEHVFYEFESEPILFSCVDEEKNLYLCLCSEIRYGQRWIIAKCSTDTLEAVVDGQIDIASAFLRTPNVIAIDMDMQGQEESCIIETDQIVRLDLPKEGTYLRCDREKAKEYLGKKESKRFVRDLKPMMDAGQTMFYSSVVNKVEMRIGTNNYSIKKAEYMNSLVEAVKSTMAIKAEYSIHPKERYIETTEKIDIGRTDNNNYLQAA